MRTSEVHQHLIGKTYDEVITKLEIVEDQGSCCGFASCDTTGEIPPSVNKHELILKGCVQIEYQNGPFVTSREVLNFIFTDAQGNEIILGYDLRAGSGSGWNYGAFVKLKLDGETLAEVSF